MMVVKLDEHDGRKRRLHIGSFFTDLNENEYQELIKIFSKQSHDVAVIGCVPYQKCPVCDGFGQVQPLYNRGTTMPVFNPCDVCKGEKIIKMATINKRKFNHE